MDIEELARIINAPREADLILSLNSGEELRLEPVVRAVEYGRSILLLMWPIDGNILRVSRSINVGPSNVASARYDVAA